MRGQATVSCCALLACLVLPTAVPSAQDYEWPTGPAVENMAAESAAAASSATLPMTRSAEPSGQNTVPANVQARGPLREVVERMWHRSPTFRRQCARLAQASLRVTVRSRVLKHQRLGALSRIELVGGRPTKVELYVAHGAPIVEMIAHELEHIVEQLDGVDLALQVKRGAATRNGLYRYETFRAVDVGRRVAREVRRVRESPGRESSVREE